MDRRDLFDPGSYRSRSRGCSAPGCLKSTRESKPFCPDHVELHPYVQEIVAFRDSREAEIAGIEKGKQVKNNSPLFEEILIYITNYGSKTVERIAHDIMISVPATKKLVQTMRRKGIIKTGRTTRGSTTVRLP